MDTLDDDAQWSFVNDALLWLQVHSLFHIGQLEWDHIKDLLVSVLGKSWICF